ncbi:MAG TPA: efflux RND transporter periplasmic adaptor subunit [Thermoanaerobaculia bacterium]
MRKKWIPALVGAAVLALIVVASLRSRGGRDAVRVYVEKVERRDITQSVSATGQVHPRVKVNISAHVIGKIEKLFVAEGDSIAAGQPFLQLERESFLAVRDDAKARLAMAQTELRQAEVALADQRIRLARARRLAGEGISAQEGLEAAELEHASAELRVRSSGEGVAQARALLVKAEDDLRKTTIWSPLTGKVIALNAEQGEVVVSGTMNNPASVIGTVADLSEILVEVDVDETEIVHVRPDLAVEVVVDALPDAPFAGRVVEVGSSGYARAQQPDVQFFLVKVLLDAPDERLRAGMSARAEIRVTTRQQALIVPLQSIVEREPAGKEGKPEAGAAKAEEIPVAFVVEDGKARQRPVRTGVSDATHVEVLEGLAEGDEVVTGPYRSLKKLAAGERVKIAKPDSDGEGEEADDG